MIFDPVSSPSRVEVITSVERRRRWLTAEKVRMVKEARRVDRLVPALRCRARLEVFGSAARGDGFDPTASDADFFVTFGPRAANGDARRSSRRVKDRSRFNAAIGRSPSKRSLNHASKPDGLSASFHEFST